MNNITLSIIIPVYNVERYIKKCLLSILAQEKDFNNLIEIIIIDDGSTDQSPAIINEFRNKDFLYIITQKNQGLSNARNTGFSLAKGKYIWFVDSDDCIISNAITMILSIIKEQETDIIGLDVIKKQESDNKKIKESVFTNKKFYKYYNCIKSGLFLQGKIHQGMVQRYIFSSKFLKKHNIAFMPNIYHEDMEFMVKCFLYAKTIICKPRTCYEYLIRENGSIMSTHNSKSLESKLRILTYWENLVQQQLSTHQKAVIYDSLFSLTYSTLLDLKKDKRKKQKNKLKKILFQSYCKAFRYYHSLGRTLKLAKAIKL